MYLEIIIIKLLLNLIEYLVLFHCWINYMNTYFLRHKKIKIDKTKILNILATKRSTFDSLHKKMEKIPDTLECGKSGNLFYFM